MACTFEKLVEELSKQEHKDALAKLVENREKVTDAYEEEKKQFNPETVEFRKELKELRKAEKLFWGKD